MSNFPNGSEAPLTFSDRKAQGYDGSMPWTLEEIVAAQRLECDCIPRHEIAERLGRPLSEVNRKLDPPPAPRADRAGVGFEHLKRR